MTPEENIEKTQKKELSSVKKVDAGEIKLMRLFYDIGDRKQLKILKEEENLEAFYKPIN